MKLGKPIGALLGALLFSVAPAASAAVAWDVQGGTLMGATGVVVNGATYNVQFRDGTCAGLFSGCDQVSDFQFQTQAGALAAGQALLDQVLLDVAQGAFDTKPGLTNGCNSSFVIDTCQLFIPYNIEGKFAFSAVEVTNTNSVTDNSVIARTGLGEEDTTDFPAKTWVIWTPGGGSGENPDGGAVPEPSTWAMMILGFGLIGNFMRRSRRKVLNRTAIA